MATPGCCCNECVEVPVNCRALHDLGRDGDFEAYGYYGGCEDTPCQSLNPSQQTALSGDRCSLYQADIRLHLSKSDVADQILCYGDAAACMLQRIAARCHAKVNSLLTS